MYGMSAWLPPVDLRGFLNLTALDVPDVVRALGVAVMKKPVIGELRVGGGVRRRDGYTYKILHPDGRPCSAAMS